MKLSALTVALVLLGCAGAAAQPTQGIGPAGTGPALSTMEPGAERDRRAVTMTGSCNFARPPDKAAEYPIRLRVAGELNQRIDIRSRASFAVGDRSNVIGWVMVGAVIHARGPVKDGEASAGMGYALLVRDSGGRVCLGYINGRSVGPAGK